MSETFDHMEYYIFIADLKQKEFNNNSLTFGLIHFGKVSFGYVMLDKIRYSKVRICKVRFSVLTLRTHFSIIILILGIASQARPHLL